MARGKHGVQAAARRSQAEYEAEIAILEKAVKGLTSSRMELLDQLAKAKDDHSAELIRLHELIAAGSSAALEVEREQNAELREALGLMRSKVYEIHETWGKVQAGLGTWLMEELNMTPVGFVKLLHQLGGDEYKVSFEEATFYGTQAERVDALISGGKKSA